MFPLPGGRIFCSLTGNAELSLVFKVFVHHGQRQLFGNKITLGSHGDGFPQGVGQTFQSGGGS